MPSLRISNALSRSFQFASKSKPKHYLRRQRNFTSIAITQSALKLPSLAASFPYRWLRDSCQCPKCVHPSTRQKLHRSSDIPRDVRPVGVNGGVGGNGSGVGIKAEREPNGIRIEWGPSMATSTASETSHVSFFTETFLRRHASHHTLAEFHRDQPPIPWTSADFSANLVNSVPYESLASPSSLCALLDQLVRYGLVFVSGMPTKETGDDGCELRILANKLGMLRNTFYGDVWDVRSVKESKNIAYTNLDLGFHMDLMYAQ